MITKAKRRIVKIPIKMTSGSNGLKYPCKGTFNRAKPAKIHPKYNIIL